MRAGARAWNCGTRSKQPTPAGPLRDLGTILGKKGAMKQQGMARTGGRRPGSVLGRTLVAGLVLGGLGLVTQRTASAEAVAGLTEAQEMARAAKIVGPEKFDNNCATCHALEHEAWLHTRHYATFKDRHRSPKAKTVLANMGQRSMKRAGQCRQCHYTNIVKPNGKLSATWGASCESCHGPAKDWNDIHNKVGGDPNGQTIQWGEGKKGSPAARGARLKVAEAKGMIHSSRIYDIATNCFGCHTVPNEQIVNTGQHLASSQEFELVSWSQGEIRHSFATSAGAPDAPTNRPATANQRRRLYLVGQMVDLEYSLRNIAGVKETGGTFHQAMIERVNRARGNLTQALGAVNVPELSAAVNAVPASVDTSTSISAGLANQLGAASQTFVQKYDGSGLGGIDSLIPTSVKGQVYQR